MRRSLHLLLRANGIEVRSHAAAAPLLVDPELGSAQCLVADYQLDRSTGIEVLRALRARGWNGRAILITALPLAVVEEEAKAAGYDAVLEKPIDPLRLVALIRG